MTDEQLDDIYQYKNEIMDAISALEEMSGEEGVSEQEREAINKAVRHADNATAILEELAT